MIAGENEEAGRRRSGAPEPFDLDSATLRVVYQETCKSHGAIVDFRAKLLALLPLATGAGVFVLLGKVNHHNQTFLVPIGLFGIAVTFGLLMYELRGIEDCTMLRERAKKMEERLGVPANESQFGAWGPGKYGLVDEIGAGWIVYTVVMFSWAGLTVYGFWGKWPWNWYWVSLVVVGAIVLFLTVLIAALGQRGRKWVVYASGVHKVKRTSEQIFWLLELAIKPGELDNFRALLHEMIESTRTEPETLSYEWFISDDGSVAYGYERYADSAAAMTHLRAFSEKSGDRFRAAVDRTRLTVFGAPNDEVREALSESGPNPTYQRFLCGFAQQGG
jgi:quinol monooxygenase YgiN